MDDSRVVLAKLLCGHRPGPRAPIHDRAGRFPRDNAVPSLLYRCPTQGSCSPVLISRSARGKSDSTRSQSIGASRASGCINRSLTNKVKVQLNETKRYAVGIERAYLGLRVRPAYLLSKLQASASASPDLTTGARCPNVSILRPGRARNLESGSMARVFQAELGLFRRQTEQPPPRTSNQF